MGLFGRSGDDEDTPRQPAAWLVSPLHAEKKPFNLEAMLAGQPVDDIWNRNGDCCIYLFARSSGKGPSFRVDSSIFADAPNLLTGATPSQLKPDSELASVLKRQIHGQYPATTRDIHLETPFNGKPAPKAPKKSLVTPISEDDQSLVDMRNLFGFLCGRALVATDECSTLASIFLRVAQLLQRCAFGALESSSYGALVTENFDRYINDYGLADVRASIRKAADMLILAEQMRSATLYNEVFSHAVGRHEELQQLPDSLLAQLSSATRRRLSRAEMDLSQRIYNAELVLNDFEIPSIFTGIGSSKSSDDRNLVKFDAWKSSYSSTRRFLMKYYKDRFGSWPPKPHSKHNDLQMRGTNRLVLMAMYHDLGALYDLLVDRSKLTNRTADGVNVEDRSDEPRERALHGILSEYDRSMPPVKPPIPFDLPRFPDLHVTRPELGKDEKRDKKLEGKKVKSDEAFKLLQASYNPDAALTPFVQEFREFELGQAKGCTISEIADLRCGQWIFTYAILQLLPMLTVDAPGLRYTDGVEYFLCEPAREMPWTRNQGRHPSMVPGDADGLDHSVYGIYRRSHCWNMAARWTCKDTHASLPRRSAEQPSERKPLPPSPAHNQYLAPTQVPNNIPLPPSPSPSRASFGGWTTPAQHPGSNARLRSSSIVAESFIAAPLPYRPAHGPAWTQDADVIPEQYHPGTSYQPHGRDTTAYQPNSYEPGGYLPAGVPYQQSGAHPRRDQSPAPRSHGAQQSLHPGDENPKSRSPSPSRTFSTILADSGLGGPRKGRRRSALVWE